MPLRPDAEVPDNDVDRIRLRERPPVNLFLAGINEGVFEAAPSALGSSRQQLVRRRPSIGSCRKFVSTERRRVFVARHLSQTDETHRTIACRSLYRKRGRKPRRRRDHGRSSRATVSFNARHQARLEAGAQRTLEAVACTRWLGWKRPNDTEKASPEALGPTPMVFSSYRGGTAHHRPE